MMTKDGMQTASVAKNDPTTPMILYPTNVAQLIATGPGVDSAIVMIS